MKIAIRLACLCALLALLPCAHAADLGGTWKGAFPFDGNNVQLTFHLQVSSGAVTGTVEGLPSTPAAIHDGRVDGDTLTFWVDTDYDGQTYKLLYKGKIAAGKIAFTMDTADGSWGTEMTALKSDAPVVSVAPDLGGAWKGAFDFQGSSVPVTFHLMSAGSAVTGTVEGLETSPAEIHDGKVDGDTLTFWLNTDYQGQTYKLVYKGKIAADKIDFSFGTDDGGWGATMTATKSL